MTSTTSQSGHGASERLAMSRQYIELAKQQIKAFVESLNALKEANQKKFT